MLDFVQQLVSGVALGCVYGLIALGFVLVYKGTGVVNFAVGEVMMLGAYIYYACAVTFELPPKSQWEGGFYPGAGAVQSTFQKNIEPALYMIELADDPYRAGAGNS